MKKLYFLFVLILTVTSCKKQQDDSNSVDITGKWQAKDPELLIYQLNNTEVFRQNLTMVGQINSYLEFKADGTLITNDVANGAPVMKTGTYKLLNANTVLHYELPGLVLERNIKMIDVNSFSLTSTDSQPITSYTINGTTFQANQLTLITYYNRL